MAPPMDAAAKKHALRLVPYGLYLMGTKRADGSAAVSLVSWFTQTSFDPPLVVLGVHREGHAFEALKETGVFSLSILGEGQKDVLKDFFKHVDVKDGVAAGHAVGSGDATGCPVLRDLPAALECRVKEVMELGDHATVLAEVVGAAVHDPGRGALTHGEAKLHYAG